MTNVTTQSDVPGGTSIRPILAVNFAGTLGFTIVVPFKVFLVAKWGGNAIVCGVLASTYSFFWLIGARFSGGGRTVSAAAGCFCSASSATLLSWAIFPTAFLLPADALLEVDSAMLGFSFFYTAFPAHAATGLDWAVTDTGAILAVQGLAGSTGTPISTGEVSGNPRKTLAHGVECPAGRLAGAGGVTPCRRRVAAPGGPC